MAVSTKYGNVTFERGNIGDDEPVFVFRAQDELALDAIRIYQMRCQQAGSPPEHLQEISDQMAAFAEWQEHNVTKIPGSK